MGIVDVAIIGGGPAGLTAAATLARQLHTAVVFDSNKYRNDKATSMHMVPGLEGKNPADFRRESRDAIKSHYSTIDFQDVSVQKVEKKADSYFSIVDSNGKEWTSQKLLLAIGSSDIFPVIEGYESLWGTRIFHCLFCKGYEDKGAPSAGVLAIPPISGVPVDMLVGLVVHAAESEYRPVFHLIILFFNPRLRTEANPDASQLSDKVTLYTHGDDTLTAALSAAVSSKKEWAVESRAIKRLVKADEDTVTVEFQDGNSKKEKFLVSQPLTVPSGQFVQQLGLATTLMGDIQAEAPYHQTNVRGVFAAGDCITPYKVIPGAISSGCNAAMGASTQLQAEKHNFPSQV